MIGQRYVFSSNFYLGWVIVGFAWTWIASITVIFLPVVEAREGISRILNGMINGVPVKTEQKSIDLSSVGSAEEVN